jgi:4-diphosphocytidyl-2-C-methyl-D-erythritol kinase
LRITAEVGSDLPQFLVGGTVLGVGRGEEVYPLPDLPSVCCVVATPEIGVSTPQAFRDWDAMASGTSPGQEPLSRGEPCGTVEAGPSHGTAELSSARTAEGGCRHVDRDDARGKLTAPDPSNRMLELGRAISAGLSGQSQAKAGRALSGVPVKRGRGRAETPLLDLVRTGIENDFERVVFPKYPELSEVKRVLQRAGALYASLSGSGSALYGLFASRAAGEKAAARLRRDGIPAVVTTTMTRQQYWKKIPVSGF